MTTPENGKENNPKDELDYDLMAEFNSTNTTMMKQGAKDKKVVDDYNRSKRLCDTLRDEAVKTTIELRDSDEYKIWYLIWETNVEPKMKKKARLAELGLGALFFIGVVALSYIISPVFDGFARIMFDYDPKTASIGLLLFVAVLRLGFFFFFGYFLSSLFWRRIIGSMEKFFTKRMVHTVFEYSTISGTPESRRKFKSRIFDLCVIHDDLVDLLEYRQKNAKKFLKAKSRLGVWEEN